MNTASSKVVLVTGASKGLGQAIAQRLVRNGHRVYGTSRKWNTGEKNGILTLGLDVTNEDSISKAVRAIIEAEGAIDVVINNAGIGIQGAIEDLSVADAHKALDTNLFGVHRVLKHVLPHMRSRKSGKIINISSIGANMGLPYRGFYSASKAALDRYSEALSIEMAPWGIQVCTIEPGDFKSDIATSRVRPEKVSDAHRKYYDEVMEKLSDQMANASSMDPIVNRVSSLVSKGEVGFRHRIGKPVEKLAVHLRYWLPSRIFQGMLNRFSRK